MYMYVHVSTEKAMEEGSREMAMMMMAEDWEG